MFVHEIIPVTEPLVETTSDGRFYSPKPGVRYASVTTVMSHHSKQGIAEWRQKVGEAEANRISRTAANRGTALHTICEKYLLNQEYRSNDVMPTTFDLFNKIKTTIDENVEVVYGVETALYSDYLRVGGRVDAVVRWNGKKSIVDFKTSNKPKKEEWITSYFCQTAIYAVMFEERTGIPIPQIVIVMAPDGDGPGQIFIKKRDEYIDEAIKLINQYYEDKRK